MKTWAKQTRLQNIKGFTIVELLIVIVVIAILATMTIVSFNGIQDRANITTINASLDQVNKAVNAYYALNGEYPSTSSVWRSQSDASKDSFIPGLVPKVINSIPRAKQWSGSATFYYISSGADYKLLYLYYGGDTIPASAASDKQVQSMLDPTRTTRGWGYWTSGATSW